MKRSNHSTLTVNQFGFNSGLGQSVEGKDILYVFRDSLGCADTDIVTETNDPKFGNDSQLRLTASALGENSMSRHFTGSAEECCSLQGMISNISIWIIDLFMLISRRNDSRFHKWSKY